MDKYFKKRKVKIMFDFLGSIIAYPFRWINAISPNYVVTLILFAVFMKLVLFPFGIKQQKNSIKQANLRPYETIIRKKYAGRNDKISQQKMNQEIMDLYQRENFNPAGGCLPMLIQLPILFALYSVITKPLTFLMQKPELSKTLAELCNKAKINASYEILQINQLLNVNDGKVKLAKDAAKGVGKEIDKFLDQVITVNGDEQTLLAHFEELKDSFNLFGINLMEQPEMSNFNILWLVPVLVFVFSFLSMKLTRMFTYQPQGNDAAASASFKLMDITMPLMSAWISFMTPAGIGIYWIIQNVLGVVQQFILFKLYPIPVMTDENLKNAEKQLRGKDREKAQHRKQEMLEEESSFANYGTKSGKNKNKQYIQRKPEISANGKARIKKNGQPPRAMKHPGAMMLPNAKK